MPDWELVDGILCTAFSSAVNEWIENPSCSLTTVSGWICFLPKLGERLLVPAIYTWLWNKEVYSQNRGDKQVSLGDSQPHKNLSRSRDEEELAEKIIFFKPKFVLFFLDLGRGL